jgi:hypothetical protein
MARILYDTLSKHYDTTIHVSNLYRGDIDGNRAESRGTPWRQEVREDLRNSVRKYGSRGVFVVDVHSLTGYLPEFARYGDNILPVIALLSYDERMTILRQRLELAIGKPVNAFRATTRADILEEAREFGVSGVLIEHNEKYTQFTMDDVKKEMDVLVEFLADLDMIEKGIGRLPTRRPGGDEFVFWDGMEPLPIQYRAPCIVAMFLFVLVVAVVIYRVLFRYGVSTVRTV